MTDDERAARMEEIRAAHKRLLSTAMSATASSARKVHSADMKANPLALIFIGARHADEALFAQFSGDEDRALVTEVLQDEARSALKDFGDDMGEANALWATMRAEVDAERDGPVVIKPASVHRIPDSWGGKSALTVNTCLYVLEVEGDTATICPIELFPFPSGDKVEADVDVVFTGAYENPYALSPNSGRVLVRPWMARRVKATAIESHAVIRFLPELHERVLRAVEYAKTYHGRPFTKSDWDRAWRKKMKPPR